MTAAHPVRRAMDTVIEHALFAAAYERNINGPRGWANIQRTEEKLALACLELVNAIVGQPPGQRPRGWPPENFPGPVSPAAAGPGTATTREGAR